MNPILAGLIAGLPLGFILVLYAYARRAELVGTFQTQEDGLTGLSDSTLLTVILGSFAGAALLFGLLSGLVYRWLGLPNFQYVAFGAVVLLSMLALVSKTPLKGAKVFWNVAVGLVLGVLVPLLAR